MLRVKESNTKRLGKQEKNLVAHKWANLIENDNRWSVYPNQPNKMFIYPLWNPQWHDQGKTFM